MREKLINHGEDIFDTYELLEMLLYTVIPVTDTNPLAKRLLLRFGSLDGVLSASREALMEVDGVGERCADFLVTVGEISNMALLMPLKEREVEFSIYESLLDYSVRFFKESQDSNIAVLLLDGRMKLLRHVVIEGDALSNGVVRLERFIDLAMSYYAQHLVVLLHHRFGAFYPTEGEFATLKLLRARLIEVGVNLLDTLIVSGDRSISVDRLIGGVSTFFSASSQEYLSFIEGKERLEEAQNGHR